MNRRGFLRAGATTLAVGALPVTAWAADAPTVFLDYTQEQLDAAYTQTVWAPNAKEVIDGYETGSAAVRRAHPPETFSYGDRPSETLDVFAPANADRLPVMVFIHGGAWRALSKLSVSAPAMTFVGNGAIYVAIDFDNLPINTLPGMADQCRRALLWVWRNAARFGGDPDRIHVAGHSSGGHLAAVMLTTDWAALGAPPTLLKGGMVLSGMCDLYPVLLSVRSSYVKVSGRERDDLSPIRAMDRVVCPVVVAWGEKESPEFKRQSIQFADALGASGHLAGRFLLEGRNHFEVPNLLNDPNSSLSKAALRLMSGKG